MTHLPTLSPPPAHPPIDPPEGAFEEWREVFDRAPAATIVFRPDGRVIAANNATLELLGRRRADVLGQSVWELLGPGEAVPVRQELARLETGEDEVLVRLRCVVRPDGVRVAMEGRIAAVRAEDGGLDYLVAQLLDVNARVAAEEALRESEARHRWFSEANPNIVWILDREGTPVYVNARFEAFTGIPGAGLLQCPPPEVLHPEDLPTVQEAWSEAQRAGSELRIEARVRQADGSYRWMACRAVPERDAEGVAVRWFGTAVDVEDMKQAEAALRSSGHLQAVGQLAAGVAHEVNNMMAVVMGFGSLLTTAFDPSDRRADHVKEILAASRRTSAITRQLLAFGRRQVLQQETLDLGGVLRDLDAMMRRLITQGVELRLELAPVATWVVVDRAQMEQVVVNLALNARDAMPDGGRLVVRTRVVHLRARRPLRHPGDTVPAGAWVVLELRDTGAGMDGATLGRALEPFFTTKPPGRGTGLGLSTVYGIVRQSGGYVSLQSELGRGTRIEIYLPATEAPTQPALPAPVAGTPSRAGGAETVLVVDDEESVRRAMVEGLRTLGYTVHDAASGAEALDRLARRDEPVHLLVTDLVMPGMSGRDLGERARRLRPGLPVLHVSGQADEEVIRRGLLAAGAPLLEKPFTAARLAEAVRRLLDPA